MEVAVNDWRGRNPQHPIDAMIHSTTCSQTKRFWTNDIGLFTPHARKRKHALER